jgi:hypothetical protein
MIHNGCVTYWLIKSFLYGRYFFTILAKKIKDYF